MEFKTYKSYKDFACGQNFTIMQINTMQELADIYDKYKTKYYIAIDLEHKEIFICELAGDEQESYLK